MQTAHNFLKELLSQAPVEIGQIIILPDYSLRHCEDKNFPDSELNIYHKPEDARQIARYDDQKKYRSLKTSSNLMRGWKLFLQSFEEVVLALDFFYPAALHLWDAFLKESLLTTPLRETLDRQSGMYRITQLLRDDQGEEMKTSFCCAQKKCLRHILWPINVEQKEMVAFSREQLIAEAQAAQKIPLLCREACNLFVAAARPVAKKNLEASTNG